MYRTRAASLFLVILLVACGPDISHGDLERYYAPKIYSNYQNLSISIPVEITDKEGLVSFVRLFESYGFSGNGPAIEQVIKANLTASGRYDSEGDAFYVYAQSQGEYHHLLAELKCIEDIECLDRWLENASTILFKE